MVTIDGRQRTCVRCSAYKIRISQAVYSPLEMVDHWKPSNAVCVIFPCVGGINKFRHSSSPVIACLRAEYIRDEAKTMWVRLHVTCVMDPETGVDCVIIKFKYTVLNVEYCI